MTLASASPSPTAVNGIALATIHRHQCDICTLNPRTGRHEMIVNRKTAEALGPAVPPPIDPARSTTDTTRTNMTELRYWSPIWCVDKLR
jgi:hypothetical protein